MLQARTRLILLLAGFAAVCWRIWHTHIAEPAQMSTSPPSASATLPGLQAQLRVWHLTDSHLNLWHKANGDVRDMCRSTSRHVRSQPGPFGHFNCDPSEADLRRTVARMLATAPEPDVILLGGDVFGHVPAAHEDERAVLRSQASHQRVLTEAFPRAIFLPVVGNHDTWPYFSGGAASVRARVELARLWSKSMSARAARELADAGYYCHEIRPPTSSAWTGLRLWVVALDTNVLAMATEASGAAEQLRWFGATLERASRAEASVLVLGHIAPGASHIDWDSMAASGWSGGGWTRAAQAQFYRALRRWPSVVRAAFFGHLHTASVRLLRPANTEGSKRTPAVAAAAEHTPGLPDAVTAQRGRDTRARASELPVLYLSPSLTPRNPTPHDPAVRLYTLVYERGGSGAPGALSVAEAHDHVLSIDGSNARGEAAWRVSSLRSELNLTSLSSHVWLQWASSLHTDATFALHMPAQRCADEVESDYARCKASVICAVEELEPAPYAACLGRVRDAAVRPADWLEAVKRQP